MRIIEISKEERKSILTEDEVLFSSEGQSEELEAEDSSPEVLDEPVINYSNVWDANRVGEMISEVMKYNDILRNYESGLQFQRNLRFIANAVKNLNDYIIGFN
jgi:hypothetical protein